MATGRYSRVDGRKSSNYCWTITVVVFVAVCLVGIWTLMTSSVAPVQNSALLSEETTPDVKQKIRENDLMQFQDSNGDVPEETGQGVGYASNIQDLKDSAVQDDQHMPAKDFDNTVEETHEAGNTNDSQDESNSDDQDDKNVHEKESEGTSQENVDERSVTENTDEKTEMENSDEKTQIEEEPKKEDENAGDDKREGSETNTEDESLTSEVSETTAGGGETNGNEQTESQESSEENKSDSDEVNKNSEAEGNEENIDRKEGVNQVEEVTVEQNQDNLDQNSSESNTENQEKDQVSNENFPVVENLEILNETTTQNGAWSTQAVESQNEKELQQSSISKDQNGYNWKVCNVTAGQDYIPCLDNWQAIKKLPGRHHYEHRERHCPDEAPTCLVPLPEGYKSTLRWPKSREKIWYYNVPHTKLAEVKGHQNWVKVTGEYLTFPGGGTQFKHGALHYIDFIQTSLPDIAWGKRTRVILDVGCGVASFGGYLFDRDVLAMSFAPKDEHEAQVQFALERGIPATLAVMGTMRLPFPSNVFDVVHCARCRVPWHIEGGKLLLELNRVLRPGGYFVWSATPVYQKLPEDVGIWKEMTRLTRSMCWDKMVISKDRLNGVGDVIYRKPTSNECYLKRARNEPPLCKESDDPNAAWNVPLQACMHKVPVNSSERGSKWPKEWPLRLEQPPYWLNSQVGVYGKSGPEDFTSDYKHWKNVVSKSYLNGMGINWPSVRNVMDMKAVYGGFAAALKDLKVWVMNVVPIDSPDTLPIIYERGLFGMYHDWCQSFNTYPRTYDLLHADHLFSSLKKRCNLVGVIAEVDRILRPQGKLIVRDDAETISEVENMAKSLKWEIRMVFSKENDGLLYVEKTSWRPMEQETVMYAIE